jgi:acyl-CoA synthetase (AMP-forming)/AMP-acid ligase II
MAHGAQLARNARKSPGKVAFRCGDRQVTYGELDQRVTRLAHAFADRGIGFGDRVAVMMTNRIEVAESYLAACRLGAIAVPVNFRLVADEIAYILSDAGATVLVVDEGLARLGAEVAARVEAVAHCLVTGDAPSTGGTIEGYGAAIAGASDTPIDIEVPESAPAFLMYTSGTTGRPKGAVITHFNLVMNTLNTMVTRNIATDDEVWLSAVPLFHIAGLNGILVHLMVGATTVILGSDRFDPAAVVDLLEAQQITGCFFVPSQWQEICAVPGIRHRNLVLRRIAWGASVAPPSVLRAMADTFPGVPNFCAFGQTEMSSVTCLLRAEDALRKMGSVGRPVVNVEARIVDDDMQDVPVGGVGEIVYRGPTVFAGYWNNPEATREAFAGGWFHSGDLCRMDEDGYIYVVDRKKDMIISGGENIYSAEVEAVIDSHPKVREVALIGVPHQRWVETPIAIIVPVDPADPPAEDEIVDWCRSRLASYKKPTAVVVVDELPRNAGGKVLKTRLREQFRDAAANRDPQG